jgi:hypothetical protein
VTSLERAVLEELTGQPATLDELATWTASPRRLVEDAVQALRLAGQPILADGRGPQPRQGEPAAGDRRELGRGQDAGGRLRRRDLPRVRPADADPRPADRGPRDDARGRLERSSSRRRPRQGHVHHQLALEVEDGQEELGLDVATSRTTRTCGRPARSTSTSCRARRSDRSPRPRRSPSGCARCPASGPGRRRSRIPTTTTSCRPRRCPRSATAVAC